MADKVVRVVIDGKEYVSKAAGEAGGAMDGFAGKIPAWGKAIALATAAFAALSKAVQAIGEFVMESIDAYDRYASSQNKMAAQSKLTGVSLADLKAMAKTAREEFNLGSVVANDAATTVAKYASRAGDATQANKLLAAALDLGAASGLTAAESMDALEQGLRGQDEGFDKLLGKNPSALWKEYADANGLAVGKMTDTQKRMAELTAVVDAGNIVQGSYNERIASGSGQTEAMSNQMDNAKVAFGAAIEPLRIFIVQGLVKLIEYGTPVVVAIARVANAVGVLFVGSFQLARSAVGALIEGVGRLTRNKSLEEWGAKQASAFPEFVKQLDAMEKKLNDSGAAATEHGKAHTLATVKITASAKDNTKAVTESADAINAKLDAKLGTPMKQLIGLTEGAIRSLGAAARDQLPPEKAAEFNAHMESLAENAEKVRERITTFKAPVDGASDSTKKMATDTANIARAGLEAAQAFGVMSSDAAATLNTVITLGESIAKVAGGDMSAIPAMIASAANLISKMIGGDAGRKRLIEDNTRSMDRLRNELGNLSLDVSGADFAGIQGALGEVLPQLKDGRGSRNQTDVINALAKRGLTMADLKKLADQLGIRIFSDSGALDVRGLNDLFRALPDVELGMFGQDFNSQKQSTTAGFGVNQTNDLGQIGALGSLGGKFSDALKGVVDVNDLAGTRDRLKALFTRMQNGGLSAAELGGLTGEEFLDLITDIIGRIDNLSPNTGSGSSTGGAITGGGTTGGGPTGPTIATKSLADVWDSMEAQTVAFGAYHTKHLDIATQHLDEAKVQTGLLTDIAKGVLALGDGGIATIADKGLEAERLALAAERGLGASY
jgi:hypothetical protein